MQCSSSGWGWLVATKGQTKASMATSPQSASPVTSTPSLLSQCSRTLRPSSSVAISQKLHRFQCGAATVGHNHCAKARSSAGEGAMCLLRTRPSGTSDQSSLYPSMKGLPVIRGVNDRLRAALIEHARCCDRVDHSHHGVIIGGHRFDVAVQKDGVPEHGPVGLIEFRAMQPHRVPKPITQISSPLIRTGWCSVGHSEFHCPIPVCEENDLRLLLIGCNPVSC